jgi:tetratricopeptide (TPR) repeat protein
LNRRTITMLLTGALVAPLVMAGLARAGAPLGSAANLTLRQESKPAQDSDKHARALKKYLEAQNLEKAQNYPGAVAAYKEAISLDPGAADLRIALGNLYLKNRNVIDAEAEAREAMKLAPDSAEAHKLMAGVYVAQTLVGASVDKDKARAAIKELEEVARLAPNAKIEMGNDEYPALALVGMLYQNLDENEKALDAIKRLSKGDTSSDKAYIMLAELYYQKNKFREAAEAARKAYDIDPKPQYALVLARSLLRIGRTQEALDLYKKTMGIKDPKDKKSDAGKDSSKGVITASPIVFDYAEALVYAGKYDDARTLLEPVLKAIPKESQEYLRATEIYADALRRSGKRQEAVSTIEAALKGQDVSESLSLLFALAETYGELQQFDKSVDAYEEALKSILNPDGTIGNRDQDKQNAGAILTRIAVAYRMGGKRDKALETFERMKKVLGADSPRADELITDSLMEDGRYKEALETASKAAARFPDERSFALYKAQAAGKLGDMATAEATLKPLLKNTPEDAQVYSWMSSVQLEANQLKEAEESARKAVNLEPRDVGSLVTLSIIQERQKKFKDSEATLRKALDLDPDNPTLLNNLGYYLTERNERLQEAEELVRRAVNIAPTNGSFLDSLGWLLFKQGKAQDAQKYIEQALAYSPRSGTIHDHLGDIHKKLGQTDKARAEWGEALKLSTEPEEISKIKEKLGKLK